MRLAVLKERRPAETRVAATPETVKKFIALGCTVAIEAGAGLASGIPDADYAAAGAEITPDVATTLNGAGIVLKIRAPLGTGEGPVDELSLHPARRAAARPAAGRREAMAADLRPARHRCRGDGAAAAHHPRAEHGHPVLPGEPGGLPRGDRGGGRLRPRLPDADDRGRHDLGRQCLRHGRRRRRAAGHRHGAAPRRPRVGDRCPPGGEGGDQVARRQLCRLRVGGEQAGADRRRLCQAALGRVLCRAGQGGRGAYRQAGHRHHHRAGAGPQGADPGDGGDGRLDEAGLA